MTEADLLRENAELKTQSAAYQSALSAAGNCIDMLEAAGFGRPGTSNTLVGMVQACVRENAELRANVAGLEEQLAEAKRGEEELLRTLANCGNTTEELADKGAKYMLELNQVEASNAWLREALQACRKWVRAPHSETAAGSMNMPLWEADMKLVVDALTESPAASLAAITAPLEAHVVQLIDALHVIEKNGGSWSAAYATEVLTRTRAQSLAAIQDAAINATVEEIYKTGSYDFKNGSKIDILGSGAFSKALDAARAEEHEACIEILTTLTRHECGLCANGVWPRNSNGHHHLGAWKNKPCGARGIHNAIRLIRSRGNGGEAKCE